MYIYSFISYISLKRQINKEDVLHSAQKDADKAIKKKKIMTVGLELRPKDTFCFCLPTVRSLSCLRLWTS